VKLASRLRELLAEPASGLLQLLMPLTCVACKRLAGRGETQIVCGRCMALLRPLAWPRCDRCGHPRAGDAECRWCEQLPPYVRAVRSVCWFPQGTAGLMVEALKYHGWTAAAEPIADRMARVDFPADVRRELTALVPIPLAPARQRERGFNQSEVIALALGRRWKAPVWSDVLLRARSTKTQTRLTPGERLTNVAGAFHAQESARVRLRGAHIVLVDDVVTTAATLNAAAGALYKGGARIISYVTFGRAPAGGDRIQRTPGSKPE
jgi:ComF family protein